MDFLDETAIEYISQHDMNVYGFRIIDNVKEFDVSKNNEHYILRLTNLTTVVKIELIH